MNILGTEYTVHLLDRQDEEMLSNNWQGYCDFDSKQIFVLKSGHDTITLRHEVIHAFLYESGIDLGLGIHTEECVDWMAHQMPKISNAMNTVGIKK